MGIYNNMDPATIVQIIMLGSLVVERLFAWMGKIKKIKSSCFEIKMEGASDSTTTPSKEPTPEPPDTKSKPAPPPKKNSSPV